MTKKNAEVAGSREFSVEDYPDKLSTYMKFKFHNLDESTKFEYHRKFETTYNHFAYLPVPDALRSAIDNVFTRYTKNEITYSTFRFYRASLCFGIANYYDSWIKNELADEVKESLTPMILNDLYRVCTKDFYIEKNETKLPETSTNKAKRFPQDFYNYLLNIPFKGVDKYEPYFNDDIEIRPSDLVCSFVKANILVGLRPVEWLNSTIYSDIETKSLMLQVKNAKHTHNRANGAYRTLELKDITENETNIIFLFFCTYHTYLYQKAFEIAIKNNDFYEQQSTLDFEPNLESGTAIPSSLRDEYTPTYLKRHSLESLINELGQPQKGVSDKVMKSLQKELYRKYDNYLKWKGIEKSKLMDRPALYSTRHQCISNAKSSGKPPHEIAGFFGHASSETARKHYGDKKYSWKNWGSFRFSPTKESILNVLGGAEFLAKNFQNEYPEGNFSDKSQENDVINKNSRALSEQNSLKFDN